VLLACGAAAGNVRYLHTREPGVIPPSNSAVPTFKSRSFIPLVIASTLATAVAHQLLGRGPMFAVAPIASGYQGHCLF